MNTPLIQGIRYSNPGLLAVALFLLFTACVSGQNTSRAPKRSSDVEPPVMRVSSQLVLIDALVENRKTGNPVPNLEMNDFRVLEDGKSQNISYFSQDQLPLSVVFLFDLTETVQPSLKPLAEGAFQILKHLKPQDEVSIMVFSSHTEVLQGFTTDRALASAAIEKASEMKSGQGTFIHEDMYEAIDQATKSTVPESRRVMVWFTDGTANFENSMTRKTIGQQAPVRLHTKEEATTRLLHSGVVVAALIDRSASTDAFMAVADVSPLSFIAGGRIGDINKYAELTGGPVLKTTKREVTARLSELLDQLRERYTLGYKPSTDKAPGSFCKLEVNLTPDAYQRSHLRKRDIVVRSRHGYYR